MAKTPTVTSSAPAAADTPPGAGTQPTTDLKPDAPAKPAKGKAEPTMITVKILSPVHHDGEEIEIGAELELPLDQAKALVLAGAAGQPDD